MKITVIGVWGSYPDANGASAGYLVQTDKINLLLDCGSGVLSLLQNHLNLEDLDAVILSHYHGDHIADVRSLQYATAALTNLQKRKKTLEIHGINQEPYFNNLNYGNYCKASEIDNNTSLNMGDITINFASSTHSMPCLAVKIQQGDKSFVFTGDTEWNEEIINLSKNTDVLISECSLYNNEFGKISGHLTAGEAGKIASMAGVKKLILSHLPHHGNHNELVNQAKAEFNKEVELAKYNTTLQL